LLGSVTSGACPAVEVAGVVPGVVESCGRVPWLPDPFDPGAVLGGRSNAKTRGVYPLRGAAAALVVGVASFSTTVCSTATGSSASGSADASGSAGAFGDAGDVGRSGLLGEPAVAAASAPVL
jgi:hypothetical protein